MRRIDGDGHLHVGPSIISSAGVSSYWGKEIPDYDQLGLIPDREYRLFRAPDELRKAAPSFEGKPLLSLHRPVSAADHAPALVVGAIGSPVEFTGQDLVAPLVIWDGIAIETIQDGSIKSLSCGYRYRAVPKVGTYRGERYTYVMTAISGNHCALVEAGRVPRAMVGDEAMKGKPMDPLSELHQFLAERLNPDDLAHANDLLEQLTRDPSAIVGYAALRRQVARSLMKTNAATASKFARQFPGLTSLKHR